VRRGIPKNKNKNHFFLFAGDLYINFAVGGLVEFPSVILTLLALRILGRRIPQSASFILAGLVLLLNLAFSNGI
jgi:hypothetical protein